MTKGIHIYRPSAKKRGSNGGEYRRPVNVWVVMTKNNDYPTRINSKNIIAKALIDSNVDSRYCGDRSAHGKALDYARKAARSFHSFATLGLHLTPGSKEYRDLLNKYLRQSLNIDRRYKQAKEIIAQCVAARIKEGSGKCA